MIYLVSKSPRRRELLTQIGVPFSVIDVDVPEVRQPGEPALDYVSRVAREKAGAGLLALSGVRSALVIGADTEVVLDEDVFGKPVDAADAGTMLQRLSGKTHQVISVVWIASAEREEHVTSISQVSFDQLDKTMLDNYLATDEWQGKAGAYAIQGYAAIYINQLIGSYTGVMGLPIYETAQLLKKLGALR